jgi:indole-3-glycerol phosphate synthase
VNVLAEIVAETRRELAVRREERSLSELRAAAERRVARYGAPRSLREAVRGAGGLAVIAEHKRSSPSAGVIRADRSLQQVISAYDRGGAAAVSVLTEGSRFGGSLADLEDARALTELPLLRKDFVVDPYQLHEALAAGGDAVLLIVAALDDDELAALLALASSLGLDALVEVHDRRELARAANASARLIGINNRDLTTLAVDVRRTFELLDEVPAGAVVVAESGFSQRAQLDELWEAGVHGALVGEALMRADDIEMACRALTVADRRSR